jgi:hypothetical protein
MKKHRISTCKKPKTLLHSGPLRAHVPPNSIYNKLYTPPSRKKGVIFKEIALDISIRI